MRQHRTEPLDHLAGLVVIARAGDEECLRTGHGGRDFEDALGCLRTSAHTFERRHFAVFDMEDRLDAEDRTEERPRPADAAALLEVFERIHGDMYGDAVHRSPGGGDHFGQPGAGVRRVGRFEDDESEAKAHVVGVDEVDVDAR